MMLKIKKLELSKKSLDILISNPNRQKKISQKDLIKFAKDLGK